MPCWLVLADDLTGANDTGACFAGRGLTTLMTLRPGGLAPCDVLVASTESRYLSAQAAASLVSAALAPFAGQKDLRLYKKVDSTLRGHPGAELEAAMSALAATRALVAPALPSQGRTTVGGRQFAGGAPLEATVYGREAASSELSVVFRGGGRPLHHLTLPEVRRGVQALTEEMLAADGIFLADAETDGDLLCLARAAGQARLNVLCGSSGLAQALASILPPHPNHASVAVPAHTRSGVLAVAGSRNPATLRQVEYARQHGVHAPALPEAFLHTEHWPGETALLEEAAACLASGSAILLTTTTLLLSPLGAKFVARRLARLAAAVLAQTPPAGVVLTGGEVAAAVCEALAASQVWLCGEITPGLAWGHLLDGNYAGMKIATKAGGFGKADALAAACGRLEKIRP